MSRVIPILLSGKNENAGEYFLGGRNFAWPLIGFSLFMTNMSGVQFVGYTGAGYSQGISVFSYEWMAAIILVIFVFFILPFYLRSNVFTLPEFLGKRYDERSRLAFSAFSIFAPLFLELSAALYAGAIVVNTLFPVFPIWVAILGLALLSVAYTAFGGLRAVVISDTIQGVVLLAGSAAIAFAAFRAIPSWQAVEQATPQGHLNIIQPVGDEALPWPGLLTGVLLIGLYYWTSNQFVVQRTLGARNLDHGRWGSLMAGAMKLPILFLMILPGAAAVVLYPNLENPDQAFSLLAFDLLPVGLRGMILAALIAAITSTVDSILNSVSTLVTMDFVQRFRPQTSEQGLVRVGRIVTLLATVVVCIWAPQIINFTSIIGYLQSALSYVTPPIIAVFLGGILWVRANRHGAFWTLATAVPLGAVFFILNEVMGVFSIQFLYAAGISFVASVLLLVGISLATTPPPREQVEELMWSPEFWRAESRELRGKPLYANYRFLSVCLVVSTAIIVYIFR